MSLLLVIGSVSVVSFLLLLVLFIKDCILGKEWQ